MVCGIVVITCGFTKQTAYKEIKEEEEDEEEEGGVVEEGK
tara:strand:+ start:533 stop:652 length:120 start_codon:yes stop_codon:yes gene_type:complete